jgi:O-acetyl-ADP-ribose deacetylase (regulator of RNase III)
VIHTVGPVYRGGQHGEAQQLASCYESSLSLAAEHRLHTVAFPAISCGVYGYPVAEAARIALTTTEAFLERHPEIEKVIFVLFGEETFGTFRHELDLLTEGG